MTYRAAIFDLDGTLLDTLDDLADAVNAVLRRMGCPTHPAASYKHFIGRGFTVLAERALPPQKRDAGRIAECVAGSKTEYAARWKERTHPYDGVPALLDELARRGGKMAVLSNKPHEFTQAIVAHFLPGRRFEAVFGGREGVPAKPDPAAVLEIARLMGLPPQAILYAGDSGTDMQTARRAGMFAAGVLWGFRDREELLADGAQALVGRPAELLAWF